MVISMHGSISALIGTPIVRVRLDFPTALNWTLASGTVGWNQA